MTIRVTYYALRDIKVGDGTRTAGDLVPEAGEWPYLSGYVQDGHLAAVLVVTLPQEVQDMLAAWEKERYGEPAASTEAEPEVEVEDEDEPEEDESEEEPEAPATPVKATPTPTRRK